MDQTERQSGEAVVEKTRPKTAQPPMFRVLLHNDDYTTMEFVVDVLESIFHKSPAEAHRLMMQVHREGSSVCGVYPHEIAETKVSLVHERAKANGFPLRASIEEV